MLTTDWWKVEDERQSLARLPWKFVDFAISKPTDRNFNTSSDDEVCIQKSAFPGCSSYRFMCELSVTHAREECDRHSLSQMI